MEQELGEGSGGPVHREVETFRERVQPPDVVRVLVGHEDGLDRAGISPCRDDPLKEFSGGEPGIDEETAACALDQDRVALGARGEGRDPHAERVEPGGS
ncbi:hypothetical protein DSECCO2_476750 [anaerobic digester metagenome]